MRVIAGKYRSRPLQLIQGMDIRPTADRLRETLFDILTAGNPEALAGSVWVDLFAGTGAVGIEAISRGAGMVYFVESAPKAVDVIRKNLQSLSITAGFEILKSEANRGVVSLKARGVTPDFVFLDPPYSMENAYRQTLEALGKSKLAGPQTVIIAEHQKRFDPGEAAPLVRSRTVRQGDAALSFYRLGE